MNQNARLKKRWKKEKLPLLATEAIFKFLPVMKKATEQPVTNFNSLSVNPLYKKVIYIRHFSMFCLNYHFDCSIYLCYLYHFSFKLTYESSNSKSNPGFSKSGR